MPTTHTNVVSSTLNQAPTLAVAYLRYSPRNGPTLSLASQALSLDHYTRSHHLHTLASYADQNISGATPIHERPSLPHALAHLASLAKQYPKSPLTLLVAKRDRLARDAMLIHLIRYALPPRATLTSAMGEGNGDDPSSRLMAHIVDGMAEYERALIRARTKAALQALALQGKRVGSVPYGYASLSDGTLIPDPSEQATIALVHALMAQGLGARRIRASLEQRGIVGRGGRPMALSQVQRLMPRPLAA